MKICERKECNNILANNNKYCCLRCANIVNSKKPRVDRTKVCKFCGSLFDRGELQQIFCSRSCSARHNNALRTKAERKCLNCGLKVKSNIKSLYCTRNCRQEHEITLWLDGKLDGCWKYTHAGYVQKYLEKRSGLVCEMPDCNEQRRRGNGSHILQVDHIDGNWRNNRPENLRLICPSCHALTENWGAANKGNGRKWKALYSQY